MIYSGIQNGISDNRDIVIVDTAGRIHIRDDLMEELFKNFKTVKKVLGREADMVFLVIDATIGQNMKSQVEKFSNKIKIDGIIITKLDGSAKAGAIISAIDETNIPIKIIGMGEGIDDIMPFRVDDFCKNLFGL